LRQGCGVWDRQSSPLDWGISKSTARVFFVVLVAEKSWQKGLGQGLLDGCKLRANSFDNSLNKLPLLLQRFL
jgi:hypothetical protein